MLFEATPIDKALYSDVALPTAIAASTHASAFNKVLECYQPSRSRVKQSA
jgi:hypothetical protein